jgi:hypothetical protein
MTSYEGASIEMLTVSTSVNPLSDPADFSGIAVASGGVIRGQSLMPVSGKADVDLWNDPIMVPKDGSVTFQLWAKATMVFPSTVNPGGEGIARSGDSPALGIASDLVTGEWTDAYLGNLNVRATGQNSVERLYAAKGAAMGNPMTLRKSVPFIVKQSLYSTTLANIDQDLIKFQVAADSAGPIAIRQFRFSVPKSSGVSLSGYKLRRGSMDLPSTDVWFNINIPDQDSMIVKFTQDELITGSGNVYTVHAVVSGAVSGSWITTSLVQADPEPTPVTGFIAGCYPAGMWVSVSPIHTDEMQYGCEPLGILWSDLSELPHDPYGNESGDWTNDALVQNTVLVQTLSN